MNPRCWICGRYGKRSAVSSSLYTCAHCDTQWRVTTIDLVSGIKAAQAGALRHYDVEAVDFGQPNTSSPA